MIQNANQGREGSAATERSACLLSTQFGHQRPILPLGATEKTKRDKQAAHHAGDDARGYLL